MTVADTYGRVGVMVKKKMEYIQDENETSDWLVYAEYVVWTLSQQAQGLSQPKIEDGRCGSSQPECDLTELPF